MLKFKKHLAINPYVFKIKEVSTNEFMFVWTRPFARPPLIPNVIIIKDSEPDAISTKSVVNNSQNNGGSESNNRCIDSLNIIATAVWGALQGKFQGIPRPLATPAL